MDPKQLLYLVRAIVTVVAGLALWWGWSEFKATIRAPVEAKLDAAVGVNHAQKAGSDAQTAAVAALHEAGEQKKAASVAAVKAAGEDHLNRAQGIKAAPAAGSTPLERAANRINAEFKR